MLWLPVHVCRRTLVISKRYNVKIPFLPLQVGHSTTSRSRFSKKLPVISQNVSLNAPRSIMTLRLSGHLSIFGLVFFAFTCLLGIVKKWSRKNCAITSLKHQSCSEF